MPRAKPEPRLPPWEWSFLTPRYWPTWVLVLLLGIASRLPYRLRLALGSVLGTVLRVMLAERRRVAAINIAACFPALDARRRAALLREHFRAVGRGFMDMGVAWWGDGERLRRQSRVEGIEHLEHALADGRGVILMAGHFTTMEVGVRILTLCAPVPFLYSIYRRSKNPLFERVMLSGRSGQPVVMFPREDVRTMIGALRDRMAVCFFPDQDHGRRHSVFVPFCGVPAATVTTTARFARMTGARVVPCFQERLPGAAGYRLWLMPALEDFPSGDDAADTVRLSAIIEREVRARPHEYYWIHRRFKTRPEGARDLYAPADGAEGS